MQFELQTDTNPNTDKGKIGLRRIKIALNRLGYYMPSKAKGINAESDLKVNRAIKAFQKDSFLPVTTHVKANDRTEEAINQAIENQEKRSQAFARRYIWRSVKDDKARHSHTARDGQIFLWDRPPKGGHPGEDYNCRCWAEPLVPVTPKGLKDSQNDLINPVPLDGINPTISPLDLVSGAGGAISIKVGSKILKKKLIIKYTKRGIEKQIKKRGWTKKRN